MRSVPIYASPHPRMSRFGPWNTVWRRFHCLSRRGLPRHRSIRRPTRPASYYFAPRRVPVNPDAATVDHLHIAVVSLHDRIHQPVPDTLLAPAVEPVVAGRIRPVALREVAQGRSRPKHPQNATQHPTVVQPRHAPRLVRRQSPCRPRPCHRRTGMRGSTASAGAQPRLRAVLKRAACQRGKLGRSGP